MALHHIAPAEVARLATLSQLSDGRTHALATTERFEAMRLVVAAGVAIAEHAVRGPHHPPLMEGHPRMAPDLESERLGPPASPFFAALAPPGRESGIGSSPYAAGPPIE